MWKNDFEKVVNKYGCNSGCTLGICAERNVIFNMLTDGIVFIIKKIRKKKEWSKGWNRVYRSGVIAVVLTALVIGYGRYNIFHVVRTEYTVNTQKDIRSEGHQLALLSDLHYGISMDDDKLQKAADRIMPKMPTTASFSRYMAFHSASWVSAAYSAKACAVSGTSQPPRSSSGCGRSQW